MTEFTMSKLSLASYQFSRLKHIHTSQHTFWENWTAWDFFVHTDECSCKSQ